MSVVFHELELNSLYFQLYRRLNWYLIWLNYHYFVAFFIFFTSFILCYFLIKLVATGLIYFLFQSLSIYLLNLYFFRHLIFLDFHSPTCFFHNLFYFFV